MTARLLPWSAAVSILATATPAYAYIGPGVGLGAIGIVLGVIGSIVLGIFSVLWYPLKRLFRRIRRSRIGSGPRD